MVGSITGGIEAGKAFVKLAIKDETRKGLNAVQRNLTRFSARMATFSRRMAITAGMIGAPIIASLRAFAAFEKQMAEVSTMLDKPQEHMKRFSSEIQRMSMQFGESTETLSKGLYQILSATIDASKALAVLHASAKAAIAGLSDTTTAADLITTVLNSYNMEASEATRVSDILFATIKRGKTTFAELAQFLGKLTAVSAEVGVKFEEVAATIALLTRNGVQTEVAVTAIRQALASLVKPAKQSADEFERIFGMAMSPKAIARMGGLPGFLKELSEQTVQSIARIFPNVRALMGVLPAARNQKELKDDVDAIENSAGATEEAYEKMTKTLAFQLDRLKKSFTVFLQVLGKQFVPEVKDLGEAFQAIATGTVAWIDKQKRFLMTIGKVVVGILGLSVAAFAASKAISVITFTMTALLAISKVLLAVLMAIVAHPIIVIGVVGTLMALVMAAGDQWTKFEKHTAEVWDNMKTNAHKAMMGILTALKTGNLDLAMEILIAGLEVLWEDFWFFLKDGFRTLFGDIIMIADKAGVGIAKQLNKFDEWRWESGGKKVDPPNLGGGDLKNKRWMDWIISFQEQFPEKTAEMMQKAREQSEGKIASTVGFVTGTDQKTRQDIIFNRMMWEEARTQYGKQVMGLKAKEFSDMTKGLEAIGDQLSDPNYFGDEQFRRREEHRRKMEALQDKLDDRIAQAKADELKIQEQYSTKSRLFSQAMAEGVKEMDDAENAAALAGLGIDEDQNNTQRGLLRGLTGAFNTVGAMRIAMSAMLPPVIGVDERIASASERTAEILARIDRKMLGWTEE